jgi:uncharacterized membrane protein YeaQ/YmgE (transglycosylase-associated protein family)
LAVNRRRDKPAHLADSVAGASGRGGSAPGGLFQIKEKSMSLLWTILVGFVVGVIAKFVHPGKENMGLIMTMLLGIGGSLLAGYVGQAIGWYQAGQGAGFIGSLVGAVVILVIYGMIKGKSGTSI